MDKATVQGRRGTQPNGASLAAVMAAGVGALAVGLLVLVNEAGLYSAPALYGPSGGLSGRSTFAVAIWLAAWTVLHARWKARAVEPGHVFGWTLGLVALAVLMCLPPLWEVL